MSIEPAATKDFSNLTVALANAFETDPVVSWVLRKDAHRRRALEHFFATALGLYRPLGRIYTDASRKGCAMWAPPHRWRLGWLRQLTLIPTMARIAGVDRIGIAARALQAMEREHPRAAHLYLYQLGVDPAAQGQGIGALLLRHGLREADRERLPTYLETGNEKNLPFYRHFGFEIQKTMEIGPGAPPVWLMWREPP